MAAEGILRLMALRPPRPVSGGKHFIDVHLGESPLQRDLVRALERQANRADLVALAKRHQVVEGLDLAPLERWARAHARAPLDVGKLEQLIVRTYRISSSALVAQPDFRAAEEAAADRVLAAAVGAASQDTGIAALETAKIAGLLRAAADRELAGPAQEPLGQLLASAVVRLPPLPKLPAPRAPVARPADDHGEAERRRWVASLRAAHRDLTRNVLERPARIATATITGEGVRALPPSNPFLTRDEVTPDTVTALERLGVDIARTRPEIAADEVERALVEVDRPSLSTGGVIRFRSGEIDRRAFRSLLPASSLSGLVSTLLPLAETRAAVADLLIVRQDIKGYELGEFAHVENILAGESRDREHRRLTRVEELSETETENETESEKDLQSTERHELQTEAARAVKDQQQLEAGLQISGSYGPALSFTANTKVGFTSSSEESERKTSSFAQEVTQRTAERVRERVRTLIRRKTLEEIEETNKHGFKNDSASHQRGVYRWLNKRYDAQVFSYGQRMMFDFVVPEPAAYFLYAVVEHAPIDTDVVKPEAPTFDGRDLRPSDLTETNYHWYVGKYRVTGVPTPPQVHRTVSAFEKQDGGEPQNFGRAGKLDIPEGYSAYMATVAVRRVASVAVGNLPSAFVAIGGELFELSRQNDGIEKLAFGLHRIRELAYAFQFSQTLAFAVAIDVHCSVTTRALDQWKQRAYDSILQAYEQQLANYNERRAAEQVRRGDQAFGENPLVNRRIERDELKRWIVMMLTSDPELDLNSFQDTADGEPVIDLARAERNGRIIRFLENAFEWNNMVYVLYPHFWGRRARWIPALQITDPDPDFAAFLRAGAARVQIPVRPGFERAVAHFIRFQDVWETGEPFLVDGDPYIPIVDEITENLGKLDEGVPYPAGSQPWTVIVPTDLVLVQDPADVPALTDVLTGKPIMVGSPS